MFKALRSCSEHTMKLSNFISLPNNMTKMSWHSNDIQIVIGKII